MNSLATTAKLTILVDNKAKSGLHFEHGFAVLLETPNHYLLFDTGQGEAFNLNTITLNTNLTRVNSVIISHGHYDHTGGLPIIYEQSPNAHIYLHPLATIPRYSIRDGVAKSIAISEKSKLALNKVSKLNLHEVTSPIRLVDGLVISGPIPRQNQIEDVGGPFYKDAYGKQPDDIIDEIALWFNTKNGLVIIVGCSHAGIINTIIHAQDISGEKRVHCVLGGFHLNSASEHRLNYTIDALKELSPDIIVPCHCTGEHAISRIKETFQNRCIEGEAGTILTFSDFT
ncbi:MAG: MBL fold metallo-hydrolase [Deltaproteobacteria bacterium]|nr:MBL fold metallo-hydrolase [Deltaproteobacteria bacterium]